ncbi:major facilitator superfamily transporter [Cryptosporidium muris RN66]|uniref:Lysosomal dipeptide transporter MFSD1 n=1 Tax=Cryptosporidium muris (strain RN66) TaxID=441375 RepID=B6AGH4_CRYMR|nr:major facilitator superfamily transporter [Cryptosporidium muris RN66]EEA07315.1 major facilitator superfamily protein [Cryptosporidium muris RN66]|eukprot:XP_002141664.1 major facilitator superfamily transporter [Cryptosporidium muris RN66]
MDHIECISPMVARWMLLISISLVTMGIMYSNDTLPAIAPFIFDVFETVYSKEEFEYYYNLLCSLVSVPNTIFPLLSGVLIDSVSLYYLSSIFIGFLITGQFILSLGFSMKSLSIMLLGRCIFGLGSESSLITFNSLLIRYFPEWEVALALSICLAIGRIGSVLSDMVSPIIATILPVYWTLVFGLGILIIGGISVLISLNKYYKECLNMHKIRNNSEIIANGNNLKRLILDNGNLVSPNDEIINKRSNLKYRITLITRKVGELGRLYWYLAILGLLSYSVIMPFNYIAGPLIVETRYKDISTVTARQYAGIIMSLLYAVSVLVLPILGWIVDRVCERCKLLTISVGLLAIAHTLMLKLHPAISITILGFGYTLFATVYWPCISISVPSNLLGTALGVATCIQNIGFIVTPIEVAFLHSTFRSYFVVEAFFLFISIMALIMCYLVTALDKELCGRLDFAANTNVNISNDLEHLIIQSSYKKNKIKLGELISYKSGNNLNINRTSINSPLSTTDDSDSDQNVKSSVFINAKTTLQITDYPVNILIKGNSD